MRHTHTTDGQRRKCSARLAWGLRQGGVGILVGLLLLPVGVMAQEAGDLDTSFGGDGLVTTDFGDFGTAHAVALQPDGKIVAAGVSVAVGVSRDDFALARYHPDGTLDATFGVGGLVTTDFGGTIDNAFAVALQPDGKIVAVGVTTNLSTSISDFALARYHPDGTLDATFGDGGLVTTDFGGTDDDAFAVALQPDGKIVAAGTSRAAFALARYHPSGTLDTTFGDGGLVTTEFGDIAGLVFFAVALQPDGKIVGAGFAIWRLGVENVDFALARYHPDGTLDTTFNSDGLVTTDFGERDEAYAVAVQPDGKIVSAGSSFITGLCCSGNFALVRYHPNGTVDGRVTTDFGGFDVARGVAVQPDGKIVAAGFSKTLKDDIALARYHPNGTLDTVFGDDGRVTTDFSGLDDRANALALQTDGRIVVAGSSQFLSTGPVGFALARYESGLVPEVGPPTNKEQCKHNGWPTFTVPRAFKNQGDCIQFVNTGK